MSEVDRSLLSIMCVCSSGRYLIRFTSSSKPWKAVLRAMFSRLMAMDGVSVSSMVVYTHGETLSRQAVHFGLAPSH